jgi:hypothetical protein
MTVVPSSMKRAAVAFPIPAAPPVIKQTLSFKRMLLVLFLFMECPQEAYEDSPPDRLAQHVVGWDGMVP